MKKLVIATMVFGAMSASALAVDAGTGKVHFSGSIITAPCSIAPGDENQEVPLGQISNKHLNQVVCLQLNHSQLNWKVVL